jgi:hypothetical protein
MRGLREPNCSRAPLCGCVNGAERPSTSFWNARPGLVRSSCSLACAGATRSSGRPSGLPARPTPGRVPRGRAHRESLTVIVATRERYRYRFVNLPVERDREALPAGDYGLHAADGQLLAAVERKTFENLASSLSDGRLAFPMSRLAQPPLAAVAVEARYSALLSYAHAPPSWLADQLVRLQLRCPRIPVLVLDSRRHAEDWTHRFLATAQAEQRTARSSAGRLGERLLTDLTATRLGPRSAARHPSLSPA